MNTRRTTIAVATAVAALVMLGLLIAFSGISFDQFTQSLTALGPWQILFCLVGIGSPVLIASVKWLSVVRRVAATPEALPGFPFFFHFSSLSGILGQVITPYAAGPLIRGMATRQAQSGSFLFGASTSVFEQIFDAWASLVFAGAGVLLLIAGVSETLAMAGFVVAALVGAIGIHVLLVLPSATPVLDWIGKVLPGQQQRMRDFIALKERSDIARAGFVARLYWLSVLRFWVLGFAVIAVAGAFDQTWTVAGMLQVYAAAQITRFAVFTPGNLGLAEWGWTTVLALFGWSFQAAALFALTFRIVGIAFTSLVYLVSAALYLATARFAGAEARRGS